MNKLLVLHNPLITEEVRVVIMQFVSTITETSAHMQEHYAVTAQLILWKRRVWKI